MGRSRGETRIDIFAMIALTAESRHKAGEWRILLRGSDFCDDRLRFRGQCTGHMW
jgi:hypothetical protein